VPSVRKSIVISFAEKYSTLLIGFVGIMLIARLLTPAEIGLYSVAAAITGIAQMLRDFGVGNYLIQEKKLTKDRVRAALTITMLTSWVAGAVLYFSRHLIASFYAESAMVQLIEIQCINFLLIPFTAPILALLRREMKFAILLRINIVCALIQLTVSLSLASSGYGYLSLAWASVANVSCMMLLVNAHRPKDAWVMPGFKEWRRIANFGFQASLSAILTEIAMNMSDLILGRFLGFQAVAFYSRAQGLVYLFHRDMMEAVRKVALPAFAQAVRKDMDLLQSYLQSVNYVTVFAWPFYAFLGLYAHTIIDLMFGKQWSAAVPYVRILVFAGAIGALWNLSSNALMAMGHINKILRSELIVQSVRIALLFYAAQISIDMTCYALIIVYFLNLLVTLKYLKQAIGLKFYKLLISNINSLFVCVMSMVIPILSFFYLPEKVDDITEFFVSGIGFSLGWIIGVSICRHPIYFELKRIFIKEKPIVEINN